MPALLSYLSSSLACAISLSLKGCALSLCPFREVEGGTSNPRLSSSGQARIDIPLVKPDNAQRPFGKDLWAFAHRKAATACFIHIRIDWILPWEVS